MYPNDEFPNKPNDFNSIPRDLTFSHQIINPSNYEISSNNLNKFISNLNPNNNYHSFLDLASLNPNNHAESPPNSSMMSPTLSLDNQDIIIKDNNEEDEEEMKRLKRMISNRESARRSRLRKRKQLENLQHQVLQLVQANHQLADKLNQVMESNYQLLQENAQLRQDVVSLQKNVSDMIMAMKGGLEEGGACNNHNAGGGLRIKASQTITSASITSTSMDVFQ